jgi:hypothetical protein
MSCERLSGLEKLARHFKWWRDSHYERWIDDVILKINEQGITDEDKEKIATIIDWKMMFETIDISASEFWNILNESDFKDDSIADKESFFSYLRDMGCDVDALEKR